MLDPLYKIPIDLLKGLLFNNTVSIDKPKLDEKISILSHLTNGSYCKPKYYNNENELKSKYQYMLGEHSSELSNALAHIPKVVCSLNNPVEGYDNEMQTIIDDKYGDACTLASIRDRRHDESIYVYTPSLNSFLKKYPIVSWVIAYIYGAHILDEMIRTEVSRDIFIGLEHQFITYYRLIDDQEKCVLRYCHSYEVFAYLYSKVYLIMNIDYLVETEIETGLNNIQLIIMLLKHEHIKNEEICIILAAEAYKDINFLSMLLEDRLLLKYIIDELKNIEVVDTEIKHIFLKYNWKEYTPRIAQYRSKFKDDPML